MHGSNRAARERLRGCARLLLPRVGFVRFRIGRQGFEQQFLHHRPDIFLDLIDAPCSWSQSRPCSMPTRMRLTERRFDLVGHKVDDFCAVSDDPLVSALSIFQPTLSSAPYRSRDSFSLRIRLSKEDPTLTFRNSSRVLGL